MIVNKTKQSKVCPYCKYSRGVINEAKNLLVDTVGFVDFAEEETENKSLVFIRNTDSNATLNLVGTYSEKKIKINYCPMCGRRLC